MTAHVRPLLREDAVHHDVTRAAVPARAEVPDDAVPFGAQRFDGTLRSKVETVGAQSHHLAAKRVERMLEQQQLARGVDVRALPALRVPRVADLHAIDARNDVVIASRADDLPARQVAHRPREHESGALTLQRVGDVRVHSIRRRRRDEPELPEPSVGNGDFQRVAVRVRERLQPYAAPFENDRRWCDHAQRIRPTWT